MIKFIPIARSEEDARPAVGAIGSDGWYQMAAFPGRNGSRPGEYDVAVVYYTGSFADGTGRYLVPERFADPKTSGLKATVPAQGSRSVIIDFDLVD